GIKDAIYALRGSPGSPLSELRRTSGARNDAQRATAEEVKRLVVPALHWVLSSENRANPNLVSAGYLSLAKVTDDPADIALIKGGVMDGNGKKPDGVSQGVNESAAFALGLLRRTEKD